MFPRHGESLARWTTYDDVGVGDGRFVHAVDGVSRVFRLHTMVHAFVDECGHCLVGGQCVGVVFVDPYGVNPRRVESEVHAPCSCIEGHCGQGFVGSRN